MAVGTKVGEAYVELQAKMAKFESQLRSAEVKTGKSVNTMQAKFQTLAPTLKKVGMGMAVAGGVITAALGLTVKSAMSFNKEMANIATLIPGATERVIELKDEIRTMAVEVGKSTGDLAQGGYQVISAFGDTADTVDILRISARAATAGVATTTDAINLLGAVTKGYGDTSKEAQLKVSDLAFQTVKLGVTDFPQLAASIGQVVPLTSELGVKQEELFAVMATGTGVTGKAAQVATQLRGVMQALMAPSADMIKLLEQKGYASGKAMLADQGLIGTLNIIKSVTEASNTPLQKYIGSIEGQTIALALTGAQADVYIEKLAAMRDSVGMTDAAFKEQTEGINKVGFAFEQAKIRIGILGQEIGDRLLPMLLPLIQKITGIVKAMSDWSKEHPKLAEGLVKVTAILGGVMLVGGPLLMLAPTIVKITSVIPALIAGLGAIKGAIIAMHVAIGPIGWAIEAIIAAIVLLYVAWTKNWGGIQEKTRAVVNFISEHFIKFVNFVTQNVLNPVIAGFEALANFILGAIGGMIAGLIDLFAFLPDFILNVFGTSKEEVNAFATDIRETFSVELGRIPKIAEDAFKWQEPIIEKIKETEAKTEKLTEEVVKLGETTEPVLSKAKEGMEDFGGATQDTTDKMQALEERMNKMRDAAGQMGIAQEEAQRLIAQTAMTRLEKIRDAAEQLGILEEDIADLVASAKAAEASVKEVGAGNAGNAASYQFGGLVPQGGPILAQVEPGELVLPRGMTRAFTKLLGAPTQKASYQRGGLVGTASKPSSILNLNVNFQPGSNFTQFEKHEVRRFFYDDIYPLILEAKERA